MISGNTSPKAWIGLLALLVALRALVLFADPGVRYFLGDSATYIHASLTAVPPMDRSFTYPLLIRAIALPAASLVPLLVFQAACGVALFPREIGRASCRERVLVTV